MVRSSYEMVGRTARLDVVECGGYLGLNFLILSRHDILCVYFKLMAVFNFCTKEGLGLRRVIDLV